MNLMKIFLKWDYIETWKINPRWSKVLEGSLQPEMKIPCWRTDLSAAILIDNTANYSQSRLVNIPIVYHDQGSLKLFDGYSILIRQSSINKSTFGFWEMVKENIESNGSIFDNIPYNPKINVYASNNETKVYGYFDAISISEKRAYFKSPIYGIRFAWIHENCEFHIVQSGDWAQIKNDKLYVIFMDQPDGVWYTKDLRCIDCTVIENTDSIKPSFWNYD